MRQKRCLSRAGWQPLGKHKILTFKWVLVTDNPRLRDKHKQIKNLFLALPKDVFEADGVWYVKIQEPFEVAVVTHWRYVR
jgi:hypothetical protein